MADVSRVLHLIANSASNYKAMWVFLSTVCAIWNSHRRAAGVCAGGAWQEQSSPGGTEDYRVDRWTRGLKRPGQIFKKVAQNTHMNAFVCGALEERQIDKDLTCLCCLSEYQLLMN